MKQILEVNVVQHVLIGCLFVFGVISVIQSFYRKIRSEPGMVRD